MPDALSKTIPIWCSVLNHLLFPDNSAESHELYTPPQVVSQSEHAQITALLPAFLASLQMLNLPIHALKLKITKPLRPIWLTPDSNLEQTESVFEDFHPIICCTVSRRVVGGELSEGGYIQGAGDDTENWAHGLHPSIFWANRALLLSTSENELPEVIGNLVRNFTDIGSEQMKCVRPTSCLFVTPLATFTDGPSTCIVALLPKVTDESTWRVSATRLDVGLGPHKIGSRNLRVALPVILTFASEFLVAAKEKGLEDHRIIIACESGKDISIGATLALLCLLFAEDGSIIDEAAEKPKIDKIFIRRRLGWISTSIPEANPSRATLQSVNSLLMERP